MPDFNDVVYATVRFKAENLLVHSCDCMQLNVLFMRIFLLRWSSLLIVYFTYDSYAERTYTVEPQWLEHLWDHGNSFETWVVRATEG